MLRARTRAIPRRPSLGWAVVRRGSGVYRRLRELFPYVYVTATQPWHPEFPIDWTVPARSGELIRAIFVASRAALENPQLTDGIPTHQKRS
jgi:hypothetical protein